MDLVEISPEGLEVANNYLKFGNIAAVADYMSIPEQQVVEFMTKREVKKYLDNVYLDLGYRNRNNIASLMDEIIASKLEEAREAELYSNKDLVDLLQIAHKMRMDEIAAMQKGEAQQGTSINIQNNVESPFGSGNYGKLMEALLKS